MFDLQAEVSGNISDVPQASTNADTDLFKHANAANGTKCEDFSDIIGAYNSAITAFS